MTATLSKAHILCIDDDPHVLAMVSDTLEAEGCTVRTAIDGAHALQHIATTEQPFDAVIVDARMPRLDGWRFVVEARAGGFNGKLVVFSAYIDPDERQRYGNVEVDAIVEKPPKPGELLRVLKELLGRP